MHTICKLSLKEYADASLSLLMQRQVTFFGATILVSYYVNAQVALLCYCVCQVTELLDCIVIKRVERWNGKGSKLARKYHSLFTLNAVLGSGAVSLYVIAVALAEGPSLHLGPLFFLFAAGLYAAMNNCQLPRVLMIRLACYTFVSIAIPLYDLWLVRPPLSHDLWKQLGIVIFVQYFVIECSWKFVSSYKTGLQQLEDLRVERDRVAEAYKVQSEFVSMVSHELRTPLTSIKGALDLINLGNAQHLPEDIRHVAKVGQKSSNRLATLIDDLLDFQKLKIGKMAFRIAEVDLRILVQEAADASQSFAEQRDVSIKVCNTETPVLVRADFDRLMQVMANVLSNAIKFSNPGGVVDISISVAAGKGQIAIRDYGIGIPENSQNIVFGPFAQVDSSDKREFGGTGLGMTISRHILENHDGSIDYSSQVGSGTTFTIELNLMARDEGASPNEIQYKLAGSMIRPRYGITLPAQNRSADQRKAI